MITIKSDSEIDIMRKSGEILATLHEKLKDLIKPGIATLELDKVAEEYIRERGAIPSFKGYKGSFGAIDYPASICTSINDEVVHGIPSNRVLKEGDIISLDIGVYFKGFHTDAARTVPVGEISLEAQKLIEVTKQSFYNGIKFAVPGNRIIDISIPIQEYVENNGFSVVRDYVGHGIGRELHEDPHIPNYRTKGKGPRLEKGMTVAIEPMVNKGDYSVRMIGNNWTVVTSDGSLSAHYENTIAITDNEPIILTVLSN